MCTDAHSVRTPQKELQEEYYRSGRMMLQMAQARVPHAADGGR